MDINHSEIIATLSQLVNFMSHIFLQDMAELHKGSTYYTGWFIIYIPFFVMKWVLTFLPIFILFGGLNGLRFGNRKNKAGQK